MCIRDRPQIYLAVVGGCGRGAVYDGTYVHQRSERGGSHGLEMFKVEREKGVYDAETKLPQGIDTYGPGYIDKENEVIVGSIRIRGIMAMTI